jgi:hypothetical protein
MFEKFPFPWLKNKEKCFRVEEHKLRSIYVGKDEDYRVGIGGFVHENWLEKLKKIVHF